MRLAFTLRHGQEEAGIGIAVEDPLLHGTTTVISTRWLYSKELGPIRVGAWYTVDRTQERLQEVADKAASALRRSIRDLAEKFYVTAKQLEQDAPAVAISLMSYSVLLDTLGGIHREKSSADRIKGLTGGLAARAKEAVKLYPPKRER